MPKSRDESAQAEVALKSFIDKFDAANQNLIRSVRKAMRARFPSAHELVYDNYNFFVIGYGPSASRPSEAPLSIAASAKGLAVCFSHGIKLDDVSNRLHGEGKQTRFLTVDSAAVISQPDIEKLLAAATRHVHAEMCEGVPGTLVIRSISAKQRPRQK